MRSIRTNLSIILPLITLLLSLQSFITIDRVVKSYESKLNSDYSIVIVANSPLTEDVFSANIPKYSTYEEVKIDDTLEAMKNSISQANLALLKVSIPKFYQIKLSKFPTNDDLKEIENNLKNNSNILKIETFTKSHDTIYKMFLLSENIVGFFAFLLVIVSIFLIIKQIEVWHYQHSTRLYILSLLGASSYMKSKSLFKLAILNSIISSICVGVCFYLLSISKDIIGRVEQLELLNIEFIPYIDFPILLGTSMSVSLLILIVVLVRHKS